MNAQFYKSWYLNLGIHVRKSSVSEVCYVRTLQNGQHFKEGSFESKFTRIDLQKYKHSFSFGRDSILKMSCDRAKKLPSNTCVSICWGLQAKRACLYHPIYYLISVSHISVHNEPPRVSILNILAAGTAFTNYENVKTNKTNWLKTGGIFWVSFVFSKLDKGSSFHLDLNVVPVFHPCLPYYD